MPYKNDAATVERRVVMFDATAATDESLGRLRTLLNENSDLFLQTTIDAYLTAVNKHASQSLWENGVLPPIMHRMRTKLREITNPLYSCLRSSVFEHNPSRYMPLSDFKDIYQDYRRQRGMQAQRWIRDHWHATFQELDLSIEKGSREYNGHKCTTEWINGIDCIDLPEERHTAVITTELLEELRQENEQREVEHRRAHARYEAAKRLFEVEESIKSLKEDRRRIRQEYWSIK
jgi:hypothetical protein